MPCLFKVLDVNIFLHQAILRTLSIVKHSIEVMEVDVQLEYLSDMSKSIGFSQNICNPDVLSEMKYITESGNLSTEETACNSRVVLESCGKHMEVKGEKTTKANTDTINQEWFGNECEQLKKRKC